MQKNNKEITQDVGKSKEKRRIFIPILIGVILLVAIFCIIFFVEIL